ncbi:MAG TPA: hypothetical protein HA302_07680, partial [Thermococcaceae archaeon]|nr:hypothetical protein [Thermococcaceae archaeon]
MKEKPLTAFLSSEKAAEKKPEKPAKKGKVKGPWELPEGWRWVRLGDIAELKAGGTPSRRVKEYWENGTIPWVKISDIPDSGLVEKTEEKITELGLKNSSAKLLSPGTILFSIFATISKVGILKIPAATNQAIVGIIPKISIDRGYLFYSLKYFGQELVYQGRGGVQDNINMRILSKLKIPLPPIEEQKRIVAKLDEVHRRLEEAKRLAREAREEAERLMASALHEVFSKAEEKGWEWTTIGKVSREMKPGFARNKKHISRDGVPHLRPNNVDVGRLNLKKIVKVTLDDKINIEEYYLKKGDVLFNNTNSFELVGRAAIVPEDLKYGYSNHITRIRVKKEVILPEWLTLAINYLWMQGYFREVCTRWVGQAGVNMNTLAKTRIPLPSLE